jgi:hypothetical protein
MAELRGYSDGLEVASSDGESSAGARVLVILAEMSKEEEEWGPELIHSVGAPFIAPEER